MLEAQIIYQEGARPSDHLMVRSGILRCDGLALIPVASGAFNDVVLRAEIWHCGQGFGIADKRARAITPMERFQPLQ